MESQLRAVNDAKGIAVTSSPLSQAVVAQGWVYCSGQLPMDSDGKLLTGSMQSKTRQCLANLEAVLQRAGSDLSLVVKVMIFVTDIKNVAAVNDEYARWFEGPVRPARSCVAVRELPRGAEVEIECVALVRSRASL